MRLIRDDTYLFCATRHGIGDVIECRTRKGGDTCKSLEDAFELSPDELAFLRERWDSSRSNHLALLCKVGEIEKVVIFFRFLIDSAQIGFCCVLDLPVDAVATVVMSGAVDGIVASSSLLERARRPRGSDGDAYGYILEIMRCVSQIESLKLERLPQNAEHIRLAAQSAASFVGALLECDCSRGEEMYHADGVVFSGRFCTACFLIFSMLARRYSRDRGYRLEIIYGASSISLIFELDSDSPKCLDSLRELEIAARTFGVFFDVRASGGRISAELYPYYSDVGLAGVKDGDKDKSYSLWLEEYFDGRE